MITIKYAVMLAARVEREKFPAFCDAMRAAVGSRGLMKLVAMRAECSAASANYYLTIEVKERGLLEAFALTVFEQMMGKALQPSEQGEAQGDEHYLAGKFEHPGDWLWMEQTMAEMVEEQLAMLDQDSPGYAGIRDSAEKLKQESAEADREVLRRRGLVPQ